MVRVMVVGLPWLNSKGKPYAYSSNIGMRWAHTFDKEPILSFRPFPFYLGCTAALLQESGHQVKVIDALAERLSLNHFIKQVEHFQPDYLLAESHTPSYENDKQIIELLKPLTKIVLAGPHPTALPEQVLKETNVSYVLVGEYEYLMKKVVDTQPTEKIIRYEPIDIDTIPWPARNLFKMELYNEAFCRNYPNLQMFTSRGCYYRCSYCNLNQMAGRVHRARDPYNVILEMELNMYSYKEIYFDDDVINGNPEKLNELLDLKIEHNLDIPFTAMGHLNISAELLTKMAKANCVGLKFGVESADNEVLKRLGKGLTIEQAIKTINLCKQLGIKTHLTYAIGLPGDTEETINKTLDFAKKYGDHYQISMAAPFPGTELYNEAEQNGWLNFKSWSEFDGLNSSVLNYPDLPSKKITELYKRGQANTYKKVMMRGEWSKYLKMIYNENGVKGLWKLVKRTPSIIKKVI